MINCDFKILRNIAEYSVQKLKKTLPLLKVMEAEVAANRVKDRQITKFCSINCEFSIFLFCLLQK